MKTHKVQFLPHGVARRFPEGMLYRDAALQAGVLIPSDCAGLGTCGKCKIRLEPRDGSLTSIEKQTVSVRDRVRGIRLACQVAIRSDAVCVVVPNGPRNGDRILTAGPDIAVQFNPDLRYVRISPRRAGLAENTFQFEEVLNALSGAGADVKSWEHGVLKDIAILHQNGAGTLAALVDGSHLLEIMEEAAITPAYGVAVDLGTTTLAANLVNLTTGETCATVAAVNEQIVHGADVLSRIRYADEHSAGLRRLQRVLRRKISAMIGELARSAGIARTQIRKIVAAGNTVMQHILVGVSPSGLGKAPYVPVFRGPAVMPAAELKLDVHARAQIYVLPHLARFVGGDIAAGLCVLSGERRTKWEAFLDLGTNGEVVLLGPDRMLCCSAPAGPAWEGACITWGMRASTGAISDVRLSGDQLEFETVGGGSPAGICGSGLIALVTALLRAGVIDAGGRFQKGEVPGPSLRARLRSAPGGDAFTVARLGARGELQLGQNDIREVQLAKAAIAAGIRFLCDEAGIGVSDLNRISVAGALGCHVDPGHLIALGIVPDIESCRIEMLGNTSLAGATAILRSSEHRRRVEDLAARVEYVEVAAHARFQDAFVESLAFPGSTSDGPT